MSPMNLEDIEEYLIEQAQYVGNTLLPEALILWVRGRFAELRAREKAILNNT